jgi:hypothetical protein
MVRIASFTPFIVIENLGNRVMDTIESNLSSDVVYAQSCGGGDCGGGDCGGGGDCDYDCGDCDYC